MLVCSYRLGLYDVPTTVLIVADLVVVSLAYDLSVYYFSFHVFAYLPSTDTHRQIYRHVG